MGHPTPTVESSAVANDNETRNDALAAQNRELLRALNSKVDVSPDRWHALASQHCDIAEEAGDADLLFRSCKLLADICKESGGKFSVEAGQEFYKALLSIVSRHTTPDQYAKILADLEGEGGA